VGSNPTPSGMYHMVHTSTISLPLHHIPNPIFSSPIVSFYTHPEWDLNSTIMGSIKLKSSILERE
ncbi:MAG: hypothetical protein KAT17_03635, partial [Candidatus Aminicenantes bacterium]|nr:hypothetical protein [Candidatus Aminicenantes bacterium]